MKPAVRSLRQAGVAHELARDCRPEKGLVLVQGGPAIAIRAEGQVESVFAIAAKRRKQVKILRGGQGVSEPHAQNKSAQKRTHDARDVADRDGFWQ